MIKKKLLDSDTKKMKTITIKVNKYELETITDKAKSHGLNTSTYLRNLSMNYPVKSIVDREAILALIKTNGDLGRLGGLFKLWLSKNSEDKEAFSAQRAYENIDALVDEIEILMKVIHADVMRLRENV